MQDPTAAGPAPGSAYLIYGQLVPIASNWGWTPEPPGPPPPLYPFQEEGVQFLLERPGALLCDEMGLGKSVQAIEAARRLLAQGQVRRALFLFPKSLAWDWQRKFFRWAREFWPETCLVWGPPARRLGYWEWPKNRVFLCPYETWREDAERVSGDFDLVVLDEVQKIKNEKTALAQAVRRIRAPRRWGLSGTPMENRIEELISICSYVLPDVRLDPLDPAQVREAIRPYVLRRRKADVLQSLPPKQYRQVWLDLTPAQRAAYDAAEAEGRRQAAGVGRTLLPAHLLGLLTRLKEICDLDPATGESTKLDFLLGELPGILARGEKAVVFSQYPEVVLARLLPRLLPLGAALYSGALSQWERDVLVQQFEEADWPRVLLMSLRAGGLGLTLARANHVYHFDHWWNPAVLEQAEDRVHRIGQHRPVYVTSLLTRGTVEEKIVQLLDRKRQLFAEVVEGLAAPRLLAPALLELFGFA